MVDDDQEKTTIRPTLVFFHVKRRAYEMQRTARKLFRECTKCGYIFRANNTRGTNYIPLKAKDDMCPVCQSPVKELEIDFHHAGETSKNQQRFVEDFNSGNKKILTATSTLAAGVNTGAMSVYIGGTCRGSQDVSTSDIGQMRGRAGRQSFAYKYPDQPAKVTIYTEKERGTYNRRRLQSGACLESQTVNPNQIADNLLREVRMGGINNFSDVGEYIGSSLSFFQSRVDNRHQMNIRQSLKEISGSVNGNNHDRVVWINVIDENCQHGNIEVTQQSTRKSIEGHNQQQGEVFDWTIICRDCGSEGLMQQEFYPKSEDDFVGMADSALRDLIGAGFLVTTPDGSLKITNIGKEIVRYHMEAASAVDIIHNMRDFDKKSITKLKLAIALGDIRANNDEEHGCYISKEQATNCPQVLEALGLTPETAFPAVKNIQCLLWTLQGVPAKDVPDCLRAVYMGIPDDYGGPFLNGFAAIARHAEWFKGEGTTLTQLGVQLRKQVSPIQTPLAVANRIGAATARSLSAAGFVSLHDIVKSSEADIRWADCCYWLWKLDQKGDIIPSANPGGISEGMANSASEYAKRIKKYAKLALAGQKSEYSNPDSKYAHSVNTLNSDEFLKHIGAINREAAQFEGWLKTAYLLSK